MIQGENDYLVKLMGRVEEKLQDGMAIFQDFGIIEKELEKITHSQSYLVFLTKYEKLAYVYIKQVIQKAQKLLEDQKTKISYSYFFQQSLKIADTAYYPFLNSLIQLNFSNFMQRLYQRIQPQSFQHMLHSNSLCDVQCVGCNQFYYQFLPIQLNTKKRNYKLIFLNNQTQSKKSSINLQTETEVYPNNGDKVDLLNLENDFQLLQEIIKVLNQKGGFIMIGCKKVQEFASIKASCTYQKLTAKFMDAYFVMGQSINKQMQGKIRQGINSLIKKNNQIIMGQNIQIQFVPVRPSPFQLGFDLQRIKLGMQEFKQRQLHVVLIKVNPTKTKYSLNNPTQYYPFTQQISEYDKIKHFMDAISKGMTEKNKEKQKFMQSNQISYFDTHGTCTAFSNKPSY